MMRQDEFGRRLPALKIRWLMLDSGVLHPLYRT